MVITSIITVKEEGKERGGEAVREDGGVVVAIHLDPRVAVVRRHNPEDEDDHGGDRDDQGGDRDDSDQEPDDNAHNHGQNGGDGDTLILQIAAVPVLCKHKVDRTARLPPLHIHLNHHFYL